ncbi:serine hydroxymethyltransferase [Candidatus Gracilibacteria bacterium CG17_big_fil_post_rev_8_21_14_2_50_48_13]|nr:MAG: serine hydroxymethyltransferase [Candidatus Gracilibacteria bacterium CG17_big_fil_post_rev_8_21_14_2_50_48_13]
MHHFTRSIAEQDPTIHALLEKELHRLGTTLQLIPSENFASKAVLAATGSIASNKYAEGYPGRRYYEGNEYIDQMEQLAIDRAKLLFGAEYANVQPLSGGPANMCVYEAFLQEGETVLSMDLAQGGHLTHGAMVNFSGKKYRFVHYPVDPVTHRIDMHTVREVALREKPRMIVCGASAYPRLIDFSAFRAIADEVGAYLFADVSHISGLIVAGVHPNPLPFADVVTTTTHKTLRGPRGALILSRQEFAKALDSAVFPRIQAGPHQNMIVAKAVAFHEAMQPEFRQYAEQVVANAKVLAEALTEKGYTLTTGGTDNHLMVVNVAAKGMTGSEAASTLAKTGMVTNKNMIPYDTASPFVTSGVRLGTPAMTSRGMQEADMQHIATWMDRALSARDRADALLAIRQEIEEHLASFPIYDSYA